jgi:hypothetical protein
MHITNSPLNVLRIAEILERPKIEALEQIESVVDC